MFSQKGRNQMGKQTFMTVEEVAQELKISKSCAYKIVRELNQELRKQGYLTVIGRINTSYFQKKFAIENDKK